MKGNTFLEANNVFADVSTLTGSEDAQEIASAIKFMKDCGKLVIEKHGRSNGIFHPSYHRMEKEVSEDLTDPQRRCTDTEYTDDYIRSFSRFGLTDTQVEGIRKGLTESVSIVTGLPGTGKTTILNTLCKILQTEKQSVLLVAPTGIASKRASDVTGLEASTIHRAFGAGISYHESSTGLLASEYAGIVKSAEDKAESPLSDPLKEPLEYGSYNERTESVVIIDESSMVDLHLLWRILQGVSLSTRVVLVGDVEQLPPVGVGFPLRDLIDAEVLPRTHLTTVFRQGEGSDVVNGAHAIHRGERPEYKGDLQFVKITSSKRIQEEVVRICKELHDEGTDFHVISPTHHGDAGVTALNKALRPVLNPNLTHLKSLRVGDDEIRVNDKIMITQNDYELEVFNGDIGHIVQINSVSVVLQVKGSINTLVEIPTDRVRSLVRLSYATTVHKSQGQEYHTVVIPMTRSHGHFLLKRSLVYTGITRAKVRVILVGDPSALDLAIRNKDENGKLSRLKYRLAGDLH